MDGVSGATITSDAIKEAAAAALTAAGLNADDYKTAVEAENTKAEDSTIDADVAIVGAGGAGMTAAITAAAEGKSVPSPPWPRPFLSSGQLIRLTPRATSTAWS